MIKHTNSISASDDSDTPPPSHSKFTINRSLKHSKVIYYKLNNKSKVLSLKTKNTMQ